MKRIIKKFKIFNIRPRRRFHKVQIFNDCKPFLVDYFKEFLEFLYSFIYGTIADEAGIILFFLSNILDLPVVGIPPYNNQYLTTHCYGSKLIKSYKRKKSQINSYCFNYFRIYLLLKASVQEKKRNYWD